MHSVCVCKHVDTIFYAHMPDRAFFVFKIDIHMYFFADDCSGWWLFTLWFYFCISSISISVTLNGNAIQSVFCVKYTLLCIFVHAISHLFTKSVIGFAHVNFDEWSVCSFSVYWQPLIIEIINLWTANDQKVMQKNTRHRTFTESTWSNHLLQFQIDCTSQ